MAYVRTMRGPRHSRHGHFVPGSLACAAARPLALSASALRRSAPAEAEEAMPVTALAAETEATAAD